MDAASAIDSYPYALERQASFLGAALPFPEPNSGGWLFRLSRFPVKGRETVVDVEKRGDRFFVTVSRFLQPLRQTWESLGRPADPVRKMVSMEISISTLEGSDALVREIERGTPLACIDEPLDEPFRDHYFLFFTDTLECSIAAVTNPYDKREAESWHRLINRSYGAELVPPRRCFAEDAILV